MKYRFTKRAFLGGSLSFIASAAFGLAPSRSLRPVARPGGGAAVRSVPAAPKIASGDAIIREAQLSGNVAYAVADAKTGKVLEGKNLRKGLPPASVTKAVTALYALNTLGAGHRFFTELVATGPVQGGVLRGDLILRGGGDPTLNTDRLAGMAARLKKAGVREVRGKFIVDGTALPSIDGIDKGQPDHVGYNPAISGIALNFNRVHFEWKRVSGKWRVAMDARSDKYRPEVSFAKMRIAGRETPVYTYQARGKEDHWTVASKALGKGGSRWLPVRQPEIYAGEVFRFFARAQGIVLKAPAKGTGRGGTVIVRQQSAELSRICRDFLRFSNNLMAEMVGLAATKARKGRVSNLKGSAGEMSRWAGQSLGMKSSKFVDHSGLGDASKITAEDMAKGMVRARTTIAPILKGFAMRDEKRRVIKNHPIKVNAKTGTLNFVSALAGFARAPDGTLLSFAIFAADTDMRARIKKADRERPRGGRSWNGRAKRLQTRLIERWGALYGS